MKRVVIALAAVMCLHAQTDLVGDWQGTLQANGVNLRLVLHVVKTESGLAGTLDSLDQGAFGMKLASIRQDGATLRFELAQPAAQYQGDWNAEAREFRGNWMQSGVSLPLSWKRAPAAAAASEPLGASDRRVSSRRRIDAGRPVRPRRGQGGFTDAYQFLLIKSGRELSPSRPVS